MVTRSSMTNIFVGHQAIAVVGQGPMTKGTVTPHPEVVILTFVSNWTSGVDIWDENWT